MPLSDYWGGFLISLFGVRNLKKSKQTFFDPDPQSSEVVDPLPRVELTRHNFAHDTHNAWEEVMVDEKFAKNCRFILINLLIAAFLYILSELRAVWKG